eukprot:SAG22_NODE_2483_length_2525_cov_5.067601_2_plen_113_part_00
MFITSFCRVHLSVLENNTELHQHLLEALGECSGTARKGRETEGNAVITAFKREWCRRRSRRSRRSRSRSRSRLSGSSRSSSCRAARPNLLVAVVLLGPRSSLAGLAAAARMH